MPSGDNLLHFRSLPRARAPNNDPSSVRSNLPQEAVELQQNIIAYHVAHHPDSTVYGNSQAKGLKLVEIFVRPRREADEDSSASAEKARQPPGTVGMRPDSLEGFTVCEATVEEGMLNVHGTLAGACAMLLMDVATFSSLFALGTVVNINPQGFSTSVNLVWHAVATHGMVLRFVSTTLSLKPRMGVARCEVYDKETGRLLVSGTQMVTPTSTSTAMKRAKM